MGIELPAPSVPAGVDVVAFSADGRFLFGAGRRGVVSVWELGRGGSQPTPKLTLGLTGDGAAFATSFDGRVEWLGAKRAEARCVLGARVFPVELCEEHRTTSGLLAGVFR